jgi:hypothetical protein
MPSSVPRTDTTKKREQLARRERELDHAIRSALSRDQLVRAAEGVRAAQLSRLKAELYWAEEARIIGRGVVGRGVEAHIGNTQRDQQRWTERSSDEILNDYTRARLCAEPKYRPWLLPASAGTLRGTDDFNLFPCQL